jgi:hypothetical protein
MKRRSVLQGASAVLLLFAASGCGPSVNRYALVDQSLQAGNPTQAATIIEKAKNEYGSESRVLYDMDRGLTLHLAGDYHASNAVLEQAKDEVEKLYTRHVTTEAKAFLTHDAKLPFEGAPYEQTMINVIKALNYAALQNWTEALVEARQIDHRLNVLADRTSQKNGYRDDAFARYLSGILYEIAGELNDAFIAYRKAYEEYRRVGSWTRVPVPATLRQDLLRITDALHLTDEHDAYKKEFPDVVWRLETETKELGQIVVISYNGRSPHKDDMFIDAPVSLDALNLVILSKTLGNGQYSNPNRRAVDSVLYGLNGHVVRVAIPTLVPQKTQVAYGQVKAVGTSGTYTATTQLVQNFTTLAERSLSDQLPGIAVKAVARAVVKYGLAEGVGRGAHAAAGKDAGPLVGIIVGSLAKAWAVASEEADKRSWRTLPDEIQIARLWVPAGDYQIQMQSTSRQGGIAGRESSRTISIHSGEARVMMERVMP